MSLMSAGRRRHLITLLRPGPPVSDGDGGYTYEWFVLVSVYASIEPATARDLERVAVGAVITNASHVVTVPYVAGVSTACRVAFGTRELHILGVADPEERRRELVLVCSEVVP